MMRNKHLLYSLLAASLLTTASCDYNEDNFPGYDELAHPTDVRNDTITLTASDYSAIANLKANQDLALAQDPEDSLYAKALKAVGTNKYFTDDAPIATYMPAYLVSLYPYLDNDSKVTVNYSYYEDLPEYLKDFNSVNKYNLSNSDYKMAWGNTASANYLSPSTLGEIPAILSEAFPDAKNGDMLLVNYAYSETEPAEGVTSTPSEMTWTQLPDAPVRASGNSWNFVNVGPVDLSAFKGKTINVAFRYTSTTTEASTWELKNFQALSVPYLDVYLFAKQDDGSFKKLTGNFAAGDYVVAALGADRQYYPFGRLGRDTDNYGYMYPDPIAVNNNSISAADGAYYTLNIEASENGYTLKNALGKYLYMSGTYTNFNVSDEIGGEGYEWKIESAGGADLFTITNVDKEKSVKLNFYKGSYSYGSYPQATIDNNVYAANSLVGNEGGFSIYDVKLEGLSYVWTNDAQYGWKASAHIGDSNRETESYLISPSITIGESDALPYFTIDEAINYGSPQNLTMWAVEGYSKAITPNASAVYRYDGKDWKAYSTAGAEIAVLQPKDYEQMGSSTLGNPETTLPVYLKQTYPYAQADDIVAVVYTNKENNIVATEFAYDGTTWNETTVATPAVTTFKKMNGSWIEVRVYLESTLLDGESGGFVAQDIELSGLTSVWTLDPSYGWKATGFANSTNYQTDSWLVSPELDLTKGINPQLSFDIAINFLRGNDRSKFFNVVVLTNYNGNATTATQEVLQLDGWPEGMSWTFTTMGPVDMSAYNGKKIRLAFHYSSTTDVAPTIEVKNISFKEADE